MFISDPGSRIRSFPSRIPGQKDSGSRIRIRLQEFKIFNLTNCFPSSLYDPGYSSQIRIRILILTHPVSRGQKGTDPRSGSATLLERNTWVAMFLKILQSPHQLGISSFSIGGSKGNEIFSYTKNH